jgi:hypothetical protein
VAHRSIEILIGRLITDEAFRQAFINDPAAALARFTESGYLVTELEAAALTSIHRDVWHDIAQQIDPRLQKWSLLQE